VRYKKDIETKKVKMADNLGPMAWLFPPENEQVQYLQKIALRAENPSGPKCYLLWTIIYFLRKHFFCRH
jgi:hypothetical protein